LAKISQQQLKRSYLGCQSLPKQTNLIYHRQLCGFVRIPPQSLKLL
jgi:hypothetical protein